MTSEHQPEDDPPGTSGVKGQSDCGRCLSSRLFRMLATQLESRGLYLRVVTYPVSAHDDEHIERIVITNPAARERGEIRIDDGGNVT